MPFKKKVFILALLDHNTLWSQGYITDVTMGEKYLPKALLFTRSSGRAVWSSCL